MSVLVTRPGEDGADLCYQLSRLGIESQHHPLLRFEQGKDNETLHCTLKHCDIVIAVSQYAVHWAYQTLKQQHRPFPSQIHYFAIGNKTAQLLQQYSAQRVISPKISDSEHLLDLPALKLVKNQRILILRGNGGRELIYQTLQQRGASVDYSEIYQRSYLPITKDVFSQWQLANIKQLVVTSSDQLHYLISHTPNDYLAWIKQLKLYLPSIRIEQQAKQLGFSHIINTGSAANSVLLEYISGKTNTAGSKYDRQ
ncbi:uroporphyrinogen-III synthase [Vibrio sp. S11_S32]|uniref:uroporphyrinogen-III synthase n=1 Tax=Vibrio sp. S11_S32 TaxID=2720225 RepID=UPI001681501D|nr:uroporphyrinogen-III synthase [Vibrio sp. S11_S32]MBD1577695.1 uroporphyrinogen-III synthase [Vibrio sp. S11_S32]